MERTELTSFISGELCVTPLMELRGEHPGGNRIFMKRDDLLPYALGGNKVRIALEFMKDMEDCGADAMVIYGDLRSNLCRVLALMCAGRGIPAVMAASDASAQEDGGPSFNEALIRMSGVRVLPARKDRIAEAVDEAMALLEAEGRKPYYIYGSRLGTGRENVPVRAYRKAFDEIAGQCMWDDLRIDLMALPCGTGATLAGLAVGRAAHLIADGFLKSTKILGISISSRDEERAAGVVRASVEAGLSEEGLPPLAHFPDLYELTCAYNAGGYGVGNSRIRAVMSTLWMRHGIPSDPTYTAKAFSGLLDYLKERDIFGKNVLFLHTGGTPLFYDELRKGAF